MPVPARYHRLRDRTVAAVDRNHAEPVSFIWSNGLAPVTIDAVLRTRAQVSQSMAGGRGQAWLVDLSGASAVLFIDRAKYPDCRPRRGDEVQAISRAGEPFFEIGRVDDRNAVRLICYLTESAALAPEAEQ